LSTATNTASQNVHSDESASTKEDIIIRDEAGDFRLELPSQMPLPMREDQKEEQGTIKHLCQPRNTDERLGLY
jgi:hypothetical protein